MKMKRMTMQNELKPCPFCGEKYTVNLSDCSECFLCEDEPHCDGCKWKNYLIVCNMNIGGCGAASGLYDTKEEAIEAWNRRCSDGMNMFDFACRQLSELFDAPCNYNDICDYMHERDEYFCPNCDKWAVWQCWKKYFELKYDDIYGK